MIKRHFKVFFFIFFTVVLLLAYQKSKGITYAPIGFLKGPMDSVYYSIDRVSSFFERVYRRFTMNLDEIELLKTDIMRLRFDNSRVRELEDENRRLKTLLDLRDFNPGYLTSARVIARGEGSWFKVITIDKGFIDGVRKGMAVINDLGLVGKIQEVADGTASVLLVDDSRFRASARLEDSRAEGIYSGSGTSLSTLEYIEYKDEIVEGEVVVTSGLDRLFPPGINIGYVSRVFKTDTKLFQDVDVTPFVETGKLEEVIVLR